MKKKFSIQNLEVKSFVTSLSEQGEVTVKGGVEQTDFCTFAWACTGHQTLYKSCRATFCMPD